MKKKTGQQKLDKITIDILLPASVSMNQEKLDKAWQKMEKRINKSRALEKELTAIPFP